MRATWIDLQEVVEEGAIVDDGLTHLLGAGLSPLPPQRQRASSAVVLDDHRMVDRQVVRAPLEIFEGVATRGHHLGDELIGFVHGTARVVDETPLHATPFADERIGLISSELAQVETADTFGALPQHGIGTRGADCLNGAVVLRSKSFAQVCVAAPAHVRPDSKPEQQDGDTCADEHEGF